MTHTEALDLILANACPTGWEGAESNEPVFTLDLHCAQATVHARLVSTMGTIQYEVVKVTIL